ncbi:MAG: hypothetical protein ABFS22_10780 [Pseudomonadota bacterium]
MESIHGMRAFWMLIILSTLYGCSSTRISIKPVGEVSESNKNILCGVIIYDGHNSDYLPLSLRGSPDRRHVQINYQYEVKYSVEDDTAFDLFNPLLLMGMAKSEDNVVILGRLEINTDSGFDKTYEEVIVLSKSKTIFSEGETLTDIRRKGLILMRDKIDSAISKDRSLYANHGILCNREE